MLLLNGCCRKQMKKLQRQKIMVDAIVTDPPYHLTSIVERFGKDSSAPAQYGTDGAFKRASTGFMGKEWDGGDIAFDPMTWSLCLGLLKPGGHLIAFSASRNYHRMAVAIEDAGFEIRDQIMWIYGSGFPKSLNIGKQIDKRRGNNDTIRVWLKSLGSREELAKAAQVTPRQIDHFIGENTPCPQMLTYERFILICDYFKNYPDWSDTMFPKVGKKIGEKTHGRSGGNDYAKVVGSKSNQKIEDVNELATDEAKQYEGWGTALKPAHEPIVMARKPLSESSIVGNILKHGTGGINIDGCRIEGNDAKYPDTNPDFKDVGAKSKEAIGIDKLSFGQTENVARKKVVRKSRSEDGVWTNNNSGMKAEGTEFADADPRGRFPANVMHDGLDESWAKYFYCPKTSKSERHNSAIKNTHPTVKPVELMKYLCRLITPKGGTVLDPFMGSGSTGMAAKDEGFDFIGIEKEREYYEIAEARIKKTAPLFDFMT